VKVAVTLDLGPDGTFTETRKQGSYQAKDSGTWSVRGRDVVLVSDDRGHTRLRLRRTGDTLYSVAMEPLVDGRLTALSFSLHEQP
jgi:hypothetical protein